MKKTMKKIVALGSGAALLVTASVMGTMAYLTSTTETVTNTFTVGNVKITLDEEKVDVYGVETPEADDRVTENTYKLIPGHTYVKDPEVHVAAGSETCWLFVKVTDEIAAIQDTTTVADQMAAKGWSVVEGETGVYAYRVTVDGGVTVPVFDNFKIKGEADVAAYNGKTIKIMAYAVQADGFDTAAAAWEAAPSNWTEQ